MCPKNCSIVLGGNYCPVSVTNPFANGSFPNGASKPLKQRPLFYSFWILMKQNSPISKQNRGRFFQCHNAPFENLRFANLQLQLPPSRQWHGQTDADVEFMIVFQIASQVSNQIQNHLWSLCSKYLMGRRIISKEEDITFMLQTSCQYRLNQSVYFIASFYKGKETSSIIHKA